MKNVSFFKRKMNYPEVSEFSSCFEEMVLLGFGPGSSVFTPANRFDCPANFWAIQLGKSSHSSLG